MMNKYGTRLRLAFYDASDGPRLVLFGPIDADIQSLIVVFDQLAESPGTVVQLAQQPFMVSPESIQLELRSVADDTASYEPRALRILGRHPMAIQWNNSCHGWDYIARLSEGLLKNQEASHQYLTSYPTDDATIVVSKGEYGDEVLDAK